MLLVLVELRLGFAITRAQLCRLGTNVALLIERWGEKVFSLTENTHISNLFN